MATTKSDFAQKLLHDLRLRKERMAASQNSGSSKPMSRGAHANPGTAHKGSKKVTALESVGSRSGNSIRKTSASTRSFHMEDSSNQIVLYGSSRNSEHRGDLSTAFSFVFENGGKFSKIDGSGSNPVLNFLRHISRRSVDAGRMEIRSNTGKNSSTSQFPTYSHIHIHDISKGVQKLNQILRTCSNGVNFDRYSIEVGKELLRGAMDLEESLRMLVNLQEDSDYMVYSQRKNKIKLLEEDEDDQSEIAKANDLRIVECPRFSFDKPRNQHSNKEAAQNDRKQQVMALTYAEETPRLQEKKPRSRSKSSHSRSASCVPDLKTISPYLEPKDHTMSHSKPEKGRISNVIAKLMGLEELSPKEESRATLREVSTNKKETMASMRSPIKVESQRQYQGNEQPVIDNQNAILAIRTSMWDNRSMLEAENVRATPNGSTQVVISGSHWQNLEVAARKYASPDSKTTTSVTGKQPNGISQRGQMPGYKEISQEKEKAESDKDHVEKKIRMTSENKDLLVKDVQQQLEPERHIPSKAEVVSQESIESKRTTIKTRNKNVRSLQTSKQQINQDNHELQQPQVLKKSDHLEQKQKQDLPKQKKKANKSKGHQVEAMVTTKPNKSARSSQKKKPYDTLVTAAANKKKTMQKIDAKPPKDLPNSRLHEHRGVHETSVVLPPQKKNENYMKAFKRQIHQVDAASNTRNGNSNALARSLDHESPVLQEKKMQNDKNSSSCNGVEQETSTHSEEAKLGITGLVKPENTDSSNAEDLLDNVPEEVNFSNSGENECQILEVSKPRPSNENSNETVTDIHEVLEEQPHDIGPTVPCDDFQLRSHEHFQNQHRGINEESKEVGKLVQVEHKKIPATGAAELLTESEKHLKEKLIKGQLFLNTAEALFKLNIPVSILHGNDHCGQDAETKLILDCGYELLKKKGQRQEISVYRSKEVSITYTKIRSFDDLIKQLSKDFNTLKSYGGNGSLECDTADCLSKILEKDFQKRHADVNSMWDFSWNGNPFAFQENDEIVKDVEKHMLNGLLDEITKDLLHIAMVSA